MKIKEITDRHENHSVQMYLIALAVSSVSNSPMHRLGWSLNNNMSFNRSTLANPLVSCIGRVFECIRYIYKYFIVVLISFMLTLHYVWLTEPLCAVTQFKMDKIKLRYCTMLFGTQDFSDIK